MKQISQLLLITIFIIMGSSKLISQTELEGTWIGYELGGLPGDVTITIHDDTAKYFGSNGAEWYTATFALNIDTLPKQFDIFINDAFQPSFIGDTSLAIYEILGDSVHFAINGPGDPTRPTNFTLGNGARIYMLGLQPTSVLEISSIIPDFFNLFQNYPNPFNPSTQIRFTIPQNVSGETREVTLKVYDVLGNEIATLVDEELSAGKYEMEFDATGLTSGIYFYQLKAGSFIQTNKMILLK